MFLTIKLCTFIWIALRQTELFKMELFLTLKLYLHQTELFKIEVFWHLTVCKQNLYLYWTELVEMFDKTE